MNEPSFSSQRSVFEGILSKLSSPYVIAIMGGLFLLDLAIPDPLPFVDEAVLLLVTLLLARWRGRHQAWADDVGMKPPSKDVTPP